MKKQLLKIGVIIIIFCSLLGANSVSASIITPNVSAKSAILIDDKSGQIVASKNENQRFPIASISKLILIYMVEKEIQLGKIDRNTQYVVPNNIVNFSHNMSVANAPMNSNEKYTVQDLENAALLPSSNSAAIELANILCGSQKKYYIEAEEQLRQWGIDNVKIVSASGLKDGDLAQFNDPNTDDNTENMLSAKEVAIIANHLIDEYPNILEITKKKQIFFPKIGIHKSVLNSTDKLLNGSEYKFTGLKTGTTPRDGGNFVGITNLLGRRVITVVLNSPVDNNKFTDTVSMLRQTELNTKLYNLENEKVNLINADTKEGSVTLFPSGDSTIFVKNDSGKEELRSKLNFKGNLPFKKGQIIAVRKYQFENEYLNDNIFSNYDFKYKAQRNVGKTNFFVRTWRNLFENKKWNSIF
ncbi:D-alanyl-D-alanine carboxypeptidase family protein [Companilactobacillus sp. DQM5]|uniref:D-alanyl-D-alanine carboxypeptidase family protein n=1 Tax=Companilactobacillus sp. DQM5 TaxID=3463359 RepID=UPI004058F0BB